MNAIIVSDLHLGSRYSQSGAFERFLEAFPPDHELIMNGDIIDSPYVKMDKSEQRVLDLIEKISYRQQVIWIRGNHDNGYIPNNFGKTLFKTLHSIDKRLLISHGDDFDDIMPRSRLFIKAFKLLHNLRIKLGARPVHVAEYAKKWKFFYRVLRKNVAFNAVRCAAENGYDAVACGHTHYPEDIVLEGIRYINTGAWTESPAYYLCITPDKMTLKQADPPFVFHRSDNLSPNQIDPAIPFTDVARNSTETGQSYRDFHL
jgi:UDP-2,3-diacylglucosamine pyrophosphatase LpxH